MGFLNAYLLGGLILASVPIIIHLLNRRRFELVDWAPMKYLRLTIKTNRRRLRFEQLILLALRTLAIILLILTVARPLLSAAGANWLPGHERTSRIFVIDTSLSMSYLNGGRPVLDSAKEAARQLIVGDSGRDTATLLVTSQNEPLIREAPVDSPKIPAEIQAIAPTDTRSNWPQTLQQVNRALSTATYPSREVVIITDLRQSGWADVSETTNQWQAQGVRLRVVDVGSRQSENVALVAFEQEQRIALVNETVRLRAQVRNDTPATISGASARLIVGDEAAGGSVRPVLLPDLLAGQTTDVPVTITPTAAGQLSVRFELTNDALTRDNARNLCLDVRPTLAISIVDGQPGSRPFESGSDFLALAFSLGVTPWNIARTSEPEWNAARTAASADVYVLANVATPSTARIAELEKRVRDGGSLMVFVGDQIDTSVYNDRLFANGRGLLPARLGGVIESPATGLVIESNQNSPLESLSKVAPAALARVQTKKYMSVETSNRVDGVRVLARWNNSDASPAVIEKQFGRGTVLLWLQPADKSWGDWPLDPTYVLAMRSAVTSIARDDAHSNFIVGQAIALPLEPNAVAQSPTVHLPGGEVVPAEFRAAAADAPAAVAFDHATLAGNYTFQWKDAQGRDGSRRAALTADRSESDLAALDDEKLEAFLGSLSPTIIHYEGSASLGDRGREIWRTLATLTLVLFVTEMLLATWMGRQR